ncbi:replication protein [Chitiniphilus shinanonensis]|uniref:replication protein n=1 Tax=Chitiniphilus shinanonensis TaxID=553088 RepID=UPI00305F8D52
MIPAQNVIPFRRPEQREQRQMQQQDGFIAIPNAVEDALLRSPLTHRQERVYRAILRKTLGYGKTSDYIATSQLAAMTGLDDSDVRKALAALVDMGMLERGNRRSFGTEITPNLDPESWDFKQGESPRLPPRTGRIAPDKQGELPPTKDNSKRQEQPPVVPQAENQVVATATQPADAGHADSEEQDKKSCCPPCPYDAIRDAYNVSLPKLPQSQELSPKRQRLLLARWKDRWSAGKYATQEEGVTYWKRFFAKVARTPFLRGDNEDWRPDFAWFLNAENFLKVVEGKFRTESELRQ